MTPLACFPASLRPLALCALALAAPACLPGSLSLGEDGGSDTTGTESGEAPEEASVRWSTFRSDVLGVDVAMASDGSIYVVGQAFYTPQGDGGIFEALWFGKYDADGTLVWEVLEPWSNPQENYVFPTSIAVDEAGGVYVSLVDYTVFGGGENQVRKLDSDGVELWSTVAPARVVDIAALPGGGAILVGGQDDIAWVQHIDTDGTLGWSRTFGDPAAVGNAFLHAALTDDGGVVLGGRLGVDPMSNRSRAWVVAIEAADGTERWQALLSEGDIAEWVDGVGIAADGTVLVTGRSDHAWVQALEPAGEWQWSWANEVAPGGTAIAAFPDGGFALGDGIYLDENDPNACVADFGPCPAVMRVVRLEADRSTRWSFTTDECRSTYNVTATTDGGLLALANCGETESDVDLGLYRFEP